MRRHSTQRDGTRGGASVKAGRVSFTAHRISSSGDEVDVDGVDDCVDVDGLGDDGVEEDLSTECMTNERRAGSWRASVLRMRKESRSRSITVDEGFFARFSADDSCDRCVESIRCAVE